MRNKIDMLIRRVPGVTCPSNSAANPTIYGAKGPRTIDRITLTMTLLSTYGPASNRPPDYVDLANAEPQPCNEISDHIGIRRT